MQAPSVRSPPSTRAVTLFRDSRVHSHPPELAEDRASGPRVGAGVGQGTTGLPQPCRVSVVVPDVVVLAPVDVKESVGCGPCVKRDLGAGANPVAGRETVDVA